MFISHHINEQWLLSLRIENILNKKYDINFGYTLDDKNYPIEKEKKK